MGIRDCFNLFHIHIFITFLWQLYCIVPFILCAIIWDLYSYCSFAILDVKIFELCDKGVKFFEDFFDRVGFQLDGDGFFYGLKPLTRNNPLGRTQASGHGTKEMAWNALARDEGGRDGIAGT